MIILIIELLLIGGLVINGMASRAVKIITGKDYRCPKEEYIECMPILSKEKQKMCEKDYLDWVKSNCPNVKGVTY